MMIACGPYTTSDSLSYQPLKDFLELARKEEPHAILMMGPFVDMKHKDIESGELFYSTPGDSNLEYVSHEELFADIMQTVARSGINFKRT